MSNDRSCHDCKYYNAEYGGVCFAQKGAPRVFWLVAETCDDFTYKDAKILLDPISLSKEQVRDIYEFLDGKGNTAGEALYKNICEDVSKAITEKLTEEAERLISRIEKEKQMDEIETKMREGKATSEELSEYIKLDKEIVSTFCKKQEEEK